MRIVALLATYNEERFITGCVEHLIRQGVEVYLLDNCSTDRTVALAERYLGRGLVGFETLPRAGMFSLRPQLERKEELAATLEADWFIHVDADEIRVAPRSDSSLAQAIAAVEAEGYNAINFQEFTFVPTQEAPDHDHPDFQRTMRWYYPFLPTPLHRVNAWKRQPRRVSLASSGGHRVHFPGQCIYPEAFRMRHYLFLSVPHAIRKYVRTQYDPTEVQAGWHGWRGDLWPEVIGLPGETELREFVSDDELDASDPRTQHYLEELWLAQKAIP